MSDPITDLALLSEENGRLQQANADTQKEIATLQRRLRRALARRVFNTMLALPAASAPVAGVGYCAYKTLNTPAVTDHCYIESGTEPRVFGEDRYFFTLRRSIPWHVDGRIGRFETIDDAIKAAAKLSCPVR